MPRLVATCWAVSVVVGASFLLAPSAQHNAAGTPSALPGPLAPATLVAHLRQVLGPRDNLRVDEVTGAEVSGTWSMSTHVSWTDPQHKLHGAQVAMPARPLHKTVEADNSDRLRLPVTNLPARHARGLTFDQLDNLLADAQSGPLAVLNVATDVQHVLVNCAGTKPKASCREATRDGKILTRYTDTLMLLPGLGPVAVMQNHPGGPLLKPGSLPAG